MIKRQKIARSDLVYYYFHKQISRKSFFSAKVFRDKKNILNLRHFNAGVAQW